MYFHVSHFLDEASMSTQSQISATVSSATKEELDRFTESQGLKKNYVVEQALLFFMAARRELPDEALVPARIVLDNTSFDRIAATVERAPAPSRALRELMRGRRD
jgi:S-adenosylmethionine:diacylglycerol 3-amino-3-carboxypropyl transferase